MLQQKVGFTNEVFIIFSRATKELQLITIKTKLLNPTDGHELFKRPWHHETSSASALSIVFALPQSSPSYCFVFFPRACNSGVYKIKCARCIVYARLNPLLPELRKNILKIFFDVILFRMGRKIYMIFSKSLIKKNYSMKAMGGSPGELSEELVT